MRRDPSDRVRRSWRGTPRRAQGDHHADSAGQRRDARPRSPPRTRHRARRRPGVLLARVPRAVRRPSASTRARAGSPVASPSPTGPPTSPAAAPASARCPASSSPPRSGCSSARPSCPSVTFGWALTDAATIADERLRGAVEQLERILGPEARGHRPRRRAAAPARRSRSSRGAARSSRGRCPSRCPASRWATCSASATACASSAATATSRHGSAAGFDAAEIGLLTELYWGMPSRTYVRTRAWSDDDLDAAEARLEEAGLMADHQLTDLGRQRREEIELVTDAADAPRRRRPRRRPRRARRAAHGVGRAGHGRRRLPAEPPGHHPARSLTHGPGAGGKMRA